MRSNGQIEVAAGTKLDYEATKNVYMVTLTAEDSFGDQRQHHGDHHGHQRGRGAED